MAFQISHEESEPTLASAQAHSPPYSGLSLAPSKLGPSLPGQIRAPSEKVPRERPVFAKGSGSRWEVLGVLWLAEGVACGWGAKFG
jgi:hypothetical protein